MRMHPEPRLGKKSCFYLFNHFSHVLWCYLTLFRLIFCVYLFSMFVLVFFPCLVYLIFFPCVFYLIVIFSYFNLFFWLHFICFILYCIVIFNMLFVLFYLSAGCMFRLRIMALLITSLFEYGIAKHNGSRPTSWVVLGA